MKSLFHTDHIWNELSKHGHAWASVQGVSRKDLTKRLHTEAKEEGVSIRINREPADPKVLIVYLQKVI